MRKNVIASQIILDKDGNVYKENVFTIEELNERIIATSILKDTKAERQQESPSFNTKDKNLPNEIWKHYPNWDCSDKTRKRNQYKLIDLFEVSNLGRVKINGNIMQQEDRNGYTGYLQIKGYPALGLVWNLVAETWLKTPLDKTDKIYHVHHLSNNGYDNSVYNLIWLDKDTHAKINHKIRI